MSRDVYHNIECVRELPHFAGENDRSKMAMEAWKLWRLMAKKCYSSMTFWKTYLTRVFHSIGKQAYNRACCGCDCSWADAEIRDQR